MLFSSPKVDLSTRHLNAHILIVDDMQLNRLLLTDILEQAEFKNLHTSSSGKEALKYIQEHDIDLIILDIIMPEMDGFEFCEYMRKYPPRKHIPILAQTAMSNTEERLDILKVGASDMLLKPLNPTELLLRVRLHLDYAFSFNDVNSYKLRTAEDLELARSIQLDLLPGKDEIDSIEKRYNVCLSSFYQASSEIGGDLWNAQAIDDTRLGFYIFDVAGHGVTAAINAFRAHSLLQLKLLKEFSPADYVAEVNSRIYELFNPGQYLTFLCGIIDFEKNTLTYTAAAYTQPAYFSRSKQEAKNLSSRGIPLGAISNATYENTEVKFLPGDSFMLYSDALTETPVVDNKGFLSEEAILDICKPRLLLETSDCVRSLHDACILELTRKIGLTRASPVNDDLTIMLLTRR